MEKTEAAYLADKHFRSLHVWATFIPTRRPKYKIHKSLGAACAALKVASCYVPDWIFEMCPGNKLFYLTEYDGFVEFSLPSEWKGSLTEYMKPIVQEKLTSI